MNLPGARAGIIVAAGLAGLSYRAAAPAMIAGSSVYHGWHVALGYAVGPAALALLGGANLTFGLAVLALALLGLLGWLALRARRPAGAAPGWGTAARLRAWTEAACPACLALTALGPSDASPAASAR